MNSYSVKNSEISIKFSWNKWSLFFYFLIDYTLEGGNLNSMVLFEIDPNEFSQCRKSFEFY